MAQHTHRLPPARAADRLHSVGPEPRAPMASSMQTNPDPHDARQRTTPDRTAHARRNAHLVLGLTLSRLPLSLLFAVGAAVHAVTLRHDWLLAGNLALLFVIALTDYFDGYFARKLGVESKLGAYADPVVDKVFFLIALPTLVFVATHNGNVAHGRFLVIFTIVYLLRDLLVGRLRFLGSKRGAPVKAAWWGKVRTAAAFVLVVAAYHHEASRGALLPPSILYAFEAVVLALTIASGVMYARLYWPYLKRPPQRETDRCKPPA